MARQLGKGPSKADYKIQQKNIVAHSHDESCLDKAAPLGIPASFGRIELGLTAGEYYRRKHASGGRGYGRFYLHHVNGGWSKGA